MSQTTFFFLSWLILAALLFFPATKLVWVFSVRRLQRKLQRQLAPEEVNGQRNRARVIATVLVIIFSFLFNAHLLGPPGQ